MQQRLFCPILAAAVALTAMLGGADRASAAIRITISDGTTDKVFYSTSSQTALFLTDLGAFDIMLHSTITNFPGQSSGGVMSQTINVSDNLDPATTMLPEFTFTAAVIADVAGVSTGQVTNATQIDLVRNAALARFTLPNSSLLHVVSDVDASEPTLQSMAGTVQNITTVNGIDVEAMAAVNDTAGHRGTEDVANNPSEGYTLSQEVILTDARVGVSALTIGASSGVTAATASALTPEPGSMLVWALGGLGLAIAGAARRRRRAKLAV